MEDIIKMVMSIDQKASDIMRQTQEYLDTRERDIKNEIEGMRAEIMDKTKSEAKSLYDSIIQEAETEAQAIRDKTKAECNTIESKFLKIRGKLEGKLFSRIFN